MKCKFYVKIGKRGQKPLIKAFTKPDNRSLDNGSKYNTKYFPTALIGFELDLPESLFSSIDAQLKMVIKEAEPCVEIKQIISEEDVK